MAANPTVKPPRNGNTFLQERNPNCTPATRRYDLVRGGWNETIPGASQKTLLTNYCPFFVLISELKCHIRTKNKVSANRFGTEETQVYHLKKQQFN